MAIQRYLLIAVIAALSFMLMTEWVQFRKQAGAATNAAPAAQDFQALPEAPAAATDGDIPDQPARAEATADAAASAGEAEAPAAPRSRYVRVRTDVLDLQIDLQGGDIVLATLPRFASSMETPDVPFVLLKQDQQRTYVAQSGLTGVDTNAARALYRTTADSYTLEGDTLTVDLVHDTADQVRVTKRFVFRRGDYLFDIVHRVENQGSLAWQGALFGQLKRDNSDDPSLTGGALGIYSYLGGATSLVDSPYEKLPFKDMAEKPFRQQREGGWIAIVQHYFLTAWIPDASQQIQYSTSARDGINLVRFTAPLQTVAPGASTDISAQFYAGPKDQYRLKEISNGLELSVDYGFLWWIAQPLFWLLTKINGYLGNWGWSIVVLTIIVKAAFFWLNAKAYTSMANMRRVQPKLLEIRERYADDKQKQSQEMMNLYRTEKINPLGGCLPVLVQMPVFLALYWVLLESVELRHAPWVLWIRDLSAMDPYFVLPLLMGATMFFQQKLNPPPPDPIQAKVMQWMPVIFTFFFFLFPAGLVLYYVVNNLLSIAQQYVITKRIEKAG